jgi:uncharacterized protein with HEPN domain
MQQPNQILKYLLDIESIIRELEFIIHHHQFDYVDFSENFISVRAVERNLTIIGEAVTKLILIDTTIEISGAKHIVGLRNLIVHAYDTIDPATLWRILIKDIPLLKTEINLLKG